MCYNAFGDSMLLKDIKAQVRMLIEETEKFVYYRENGELLGYAGYSKKG